MASKLLTYSFIHLNSSVKLVKEKLMRKKTCFSVQSIKHNSALDIQIYLVHTKANKHLHVLILVVCMWTTEHEASTLTLGQNVNYTMAHYPKENDRITRGLIITNSFITSACVKGKSKERCKLHEIS
jgi:hypothetical protein